MRTRAARRRLSALARVRGLALLVFVFASFDKEWCISITAEVGMIASKRWWLLSMGVVGGLALGFAVFTLVHRWEPGFTIAWGDLEDVAHTVLNAGLGLFAFFYGVFLFLVGAVLLFLRSPAGSGKPHIGFVFALIGMMLVGQAGLQLRFDTTHPSSGGIPRQV